MSVIPFSDSEEDELHDQLLSIRQPWKEDPFVFVKLLKDEDKKCYDEQMDLLFLEIMKDGNYVDNVYELKKWIDEKQYDYALDMV